MQSYWFGDMDETGCTPYRGGPEALAKRLETIKISPDRFVPFDWRTCRELQFHPRSWGIYKEITGALLLSF